MRILTIGSGTCTHTLSRAKALLEAGCRNIILSAEEATDSEIEILSPFVDSYSKNLLLRSYLFLKNILQAAWVIYKKDYDLCNIHYLNHYLAWVACLVTKKPIVAIAMGGDVLFEQHDYIPWYQKALVKQALYRSDLIIAKSPYLKERINVLLWKKNANVIVNIFGISTAFFEIYTKETAHEWIFLSTRPLRRFYKIDKIIDLIYLLNKKGFSSKFNILCSSEDPGYLLELKNKVQNLHLESKINFLPSVKTPEELITIYRQANIVIALPDSDGIPQSALEGMSQECINILPKNEVYKHIFDESNSILVSGSAESIANSIIEKNSGNSALQMKKVAKEFVKRKANLKENTEILISEFKNLLGAQRKKNFYIHRLITLLLIIVYFFDQFLFMGLRRKFKKYIIGF
jgi:glycosyltransferase involved in cell wall biosynthesis